MRKTRPIKRPRGRPPTPDAAFRRAADLLRKRIASRVWEKGTVLPSRRALARQLGLGEQTVRLAFAALHGEGLLGVNTRKRWFVKGEGRGIRLTEDVILEVLSDRLHVFMEHPDRAALRRGIEQEAGLLGAPVLIAHHEHFRAALPPNLHELALRGILLLGTFRPRALKRYQRLHVPVVLVDQPRMAWRFHAIRGDNIQGCCEATQRLLALGHRRIAFVRLLHLELREVDAHSRQRQTGFLNAFEHAHIPLAKDAIFNTTSYERPESPALQALFAATPAFTAVVATDASRATLVAQAAEARGSVIPRDLSIVCFQGAVPVAPRFSGPRIDYEEMGRRAVRLFQFPRERRILETVPVAWASGQTLAPPRRSAKT